MVSEALGQAKPGPQRGVRGGVGAWGMEVGPARLTSRALGLPTRGLAPAPCSSPCFSLLSSCRPFGSSLQPPHVSPVFNPLIIFATQHPHSTPPGGSCSVGAYTRVCMRCTPHACVPVNAGGLPGACGDARLHRPLHAPGWGAGGCRLPRRSTNRLSSGCCQPPAGGGRGNKCPRSH